MAFKKTSRTKSEFGFRSKLKKKKLEKAESKMPLAKTLGTNFKKLKRSPIKKSEKIAGPFVKKGKKK
jgi:hypothetical protein